MARSSFLYYFMHLKEINSKFTVRHKRIFLLCTGQSKIVESVAIYTEFCPKNSKYSELIELELKNNVKYFIHLSRI